MTGLNQIVTSFSAEEKQQFIHYLQKKNKRNDAKNVQLFKLLSEGKQDINSISQKIYRCQNNDALYALRKRLYRSVIDFTANQALQDENSIDMEVSKYLLAARNFFIKGHYTTAHKILDKAKHIAQEHQLFTLLNEIYHTQIQYAHKQKNSNLKQQVKEFKENQQLYILDEELNIAYAKIRKALHEATKESKMIPFNELVKDVFTEHNISLHKILSYKSLYQLATIVSISAFAKKDYYKIESFLLSAYKKLEDHQSKDRYLFYHIHVVYIIANTLFRNKKFKTSQQYLEIMHHLMLRKRKKYHAVFRLKYHLLQGLNQSYSGQLEDAITTLEAFVQKTHLDITSLLDIYLSLVMCYFQKGAFQKAMRLFSQFYHTDNWYIKKGGQEWTLKKNLIEILLHLELGHLELFESRLLSFKRSYVDYLRKIGQERVITYLSLVEHYYKDPNSITSKEFKNRVEQSFQWVGATYEDIFVMSFYAWLKSKMERRSLYETTLDLVANQLP